MTNYAHKAVKHPDARDVNDSIKRCLVKTMAKLGLGLYIYSGEGLPPKEEDSKKVVKETSVPKDVNFISGENKPHVDVYSPAVIDVLDLAITTSKTFYGLSRVYVHKQNKEIFDDLELQVNLTDASDTCKDQLKRLQTLVTNQAKEILPKEIESLKGLKELATLWKDNLDLFNFIKRYSEMEWQSIRDLFTKRKDSLNK